MKRNRWLVALAALMFMVGCTATESVSPSASSIASSQVTASPSAFVAAATPTGEPTPTPPSSTGKTFSLLPVDVPPGTDLGISCDGDIGPNDPVAIVELSTDDHDQGPQVMRDYRDAANPRTVCQFGGDSGLNGYIAQLVDARHVVINACWSDNGCGLVVVDLPEVRYHWFKLPAKAGGYAEFLAVSPDMKEVAWISASRDYEDRRLHLTRADGDHVVARLLPVGGRCGSPDDSAPANYSRSGEHLYLLDVPNANDTVFVVLHGTEKMLSIRPPNSSTLAMPIWSPTEDTLYFRRSGSVWRWTPEDGARRFLKDVYWRYPTFSPDGRYLAYAVPQDDGTHDVYLMDVAAGSDPELIGRRRTTPRFLTATQLWYVSEGIGVCGPGQDRRLIYDVNERAESRSIIERVIAAWPGT